MAVTHHLERILQYYCILNVKIIKYKLFITQKPSLCQTELMLILGFRTQQLAPPNIYCLLCFISEVKSKHFPKDQSAANLSLLHLSRLFRASLQKVLSFKIPQKDIGWTRKVTMNFSYIFYSISSHKKSFLTAFYLIFILDFFISRGERLAFQIKISF